MSTFDRCEVCRGDKLSSTLVKDPVDHLVRCSNRAQCDTDRRIRNAREEARARRDVEDKGGVHSARIVAEIESGERERKAKARAQKEKARLRHVAAERKRAKEPERIALPRRRVRNRPPKLSAQELEAREQWLRARQEEHRKQMDAAERRNGGQT